MSTELFLSLLYLRSRRLRDLLLTALVGAVTTGARPQLIPVVLVILLAPLFRTTPPPRRRLWAIGMFVAACLPWLLPTCHLAAKVTPHSAAWSAYAEQLYSQWKWRLDKPHAYIGAGDFSAHYLGLRFGAHIFGWLGIGFGFLRSVFAMVFGGALAITGLVCYWRKRRLIDRSFWETHRTWLLLHVAIIFCFLPANQRYYLVVFPSLLVAIQLGLRPCLAAGA